MTYDIYVVQSDYSTNLVLFKKLMSEKLPKYSNSYITYEVTKST